MSVDSQVYCNSCWSKAQGKAVKTSCDHCFCQSCSETAFRDRNRRCPVCGVDVASLMDFQVVGSPIPDDQLSDVRGTLQAIVAANGTSTLDLWVTAFHRFERTQLLLWGSRQGHATQELLKQSEERERELTERSFAARQAVESMEHKCEQLCRERESIGNDMQNLQAALEERSRQMENWRNMYESLKSGGRLSTSNSAAMSHHLVPVSSVNNSSSFSVPLPPPPSPGRRSFTKLSIAPPLHAPLPPSQIAGSSDQQSNFERSRSFSTDRNSNNFRDRSHSNLSTDSNSENNLYNNANRGGGGGNGGGGSMFGSSSSSSRPSNFPPRSGSMLGSRPPTRDSFTNLLGRPGSILPRTQSMNGVGGMSNGGGFPARPNQDNIRSQYFNQSSLRAVSPATLQTSPVDGGSMMSRNNGY